MSFSITPSEEEQKDNSSTKSLNERIVGAKNFSLDYATTYINKKDGTSNTRRRRLYAGKELKKEICVYRCDSFDELFGTSRLESGNVKLIKDTLNILVFNDGSVRTKFKVNNSACFCCSQDEEFKITLFFYTKEKDKKRVVSHGINTPNFKIKSERTRIIRPILSLNSQIFLPSIIGVSLEIEINP